MELSIGRNLLVEQPATAVWVVRFTRPDPRTQLDGKEVVNGELYKDLDTAVLSRLTLGETLVLNFALVFWFPTAFYQVLLHVRDAIKEHKARLILCGFIPEVQESMRLFQADKVFEIVHSEEQAVRKATSGS